MRATWRGNGSDTSARAFDKRGAMRRFLAAAACATLAACTFQGGGLAPFNPAPIAPSELDLDVPYVPTPRPVVAAMLDMAELGPDDYLIDLGSGDGRIAIEAARRGARALGVDIDPNRVREAIAAAQLAGVEARARFRRQDLFDTPIREASVVSMYLLPAINLRLRPRLLTDLRPGTRIVSHAFNMGDWAPDEHREVNAANIYLWIVPAVAGGRWLLSDAGGERVLILEQRFQEVSGTLGGAALSEVTLRGTRFRFTAAGRSYEGEIDGAAMRGEGWSARRVE